MSTAGVAIRQPNASHEQHHKHGTPAHSAGWYILRCGGGLEFAACDALAKAGWTAFLPIERKWRVTVLRRFSEEARYPRFPGYLFVFVAPPRWPDLASWPLNRYLRGVLAMDGRPVPLAAGEIERLQAEDGAAVASRVSPLHRAFMTGQQVRVTSGAFRDFMVRIDAIDDIGAHTTVQIFGRPAAVTLPLTWLEAA